VWKYFRCQKQHKKRCGKFDRRGTIPKAIVEAHSRISDWEAETVIGKNQQQTIVSIVERKSGFTLIRKVERKTALAVSQVIEATSEQGAYEHPRQRLGTKRSQAD